MTGKPIRQRRRWLAGAITAAAEAAAEAPTAPDGGPRLARPRLRMALLAERERAGTVPAGTDARPARGPAALAAC